MRKNSTNSENLIDLEESQINQTTGYRHLDDKEIDDLYFSYNLMKNFCSQIQTENKQRFKRILQKYAGSPLQFQLSPKNVMHILDKRIQRMLKNKKLKKNWSNQDTKILCWTFSHYCILKGIKSVEQASENDWQNISKLIPGSSKDGCMFKILSFKKVKLTKQKWTEEENQLLFQIAQALKRKNWRTISQQLFKRSTSSNKIYRSAKQCKQHWVCYLNPNLKRGSWSIQQDKKLLEYIYNQNGSRKWAQIAKFFGGRTQNALKNRYTLIIQRLRKEKNLDDDLLLIGQYLNQIQYREQIQKKKKIYRWQKTIDFNRQSVQRVQQRTDNINIQNQQREESDRKQGEGRNKGDAELVQDSVFVSNTNNHEFQVTQTILPLIVNQYNLVNPINFYQIQYVPIYQQNQGQIFMMMNL